MKTIVSEIYNHRMCRKNWLTFIVVVFFKTLKNRFAKLKKKTYVWNILLELRIAETYINRFKDVSNPETKFKRYKKKYIKIVVVCHFRWLPELTDNNLNLQLLKSSFLHFFFQIRLSFCVSEKLQTRKRKLDMNDERLWKLKLIKVH